jgi:hypothetical protein
VIDLLEAREPDDWLRVPPQTVVNLKAILVDSVAWLNVDIYDPADQALILRIRGYATALHRARESESADFAQKLTVLQRIAALLSGEIDAVSEGATQFASLTDRTLLRGAQSCLIWYVDRRCREKGAPPVDDLLAGAMILGYLKFTSPAPTLRLDPLRRMVGKTLGDEAKKQCEARIRRLAKDANIRVDKSERPARKPEWPRYAWWLAGIAIALTAAAVAWLLSGWD